MKEADDYLNSVMEEAMEEFRRFEEELDRTSKSELDSLVKVAKDCELRKWGNRLKMQRQLLQKVYGTCDEFGDWFHEIGMEGVSVQSS